MLYTIQLIIVTYVLGCIVRHYSTTICRVLLLANAQRLYMMRLYYTRIIAQMAKSPLSAFYTSRSNKTHARSVCKPYPAFLASCSNLIVIMLFNQQVVQSCSFVTSCPKNLISSRSHQIVNNVIFTACSDLRNLGRERLEELSNVELSICRT